VEILYAFEHSDDENLMAPEAEDEAVSAARKLVRPLLEARLQRRLDSLDGDPIKKKRRAGGARP
jgi:hypothetical protein